MRTGVVAGLILGLMATSSFGAYINGYEWNYQTSFNGSYGGNGVSLADSEGYRAFEYRYSGLDTGSTPVASTLMGSYHSWESPGSWQPTNGGWSERIYSNALNVGNNYAVQVHWIAPVAGTYDLAVQAYNISDAPGGWATLEKVWINNSLQTSADWLGTDTGNGNAFAWSGDDVSLNAGDRLIFSFSSWGSSYAAVGDFNMTAALVPEPCTMGLIGLGAMSLIARRKKA